VKTFDRKDLINKVGLTKGRSLFIALRRNNLGDTRMKLIKGGCRFGPCDMLRETFYFNKNESVRFFIGRLRFAKSDPFNQHKPMVVRSWENSIRLLRSI